MKPLVIKVHSNVSTKKARSFVIETNPPDATVLLYTATCTNCRAHYSFTNLGFMAWTLVHVALCSYEDEGAGQ
jgi:hypothetical protein